ncbi:MAG: hypothetical protein M1476_03150 [Candidatus Thermoplasmatota archaeon]|nr:hypothetical protein [Candidatus Thermoplasmatota archaeon]
MSTTKDEVIKWLEGKDDSTGNLVDIPWKIQDLGKYLVLENEKIPFSIYLAFEDTVLRIFLRTGIETAVIDIQERLGIYRTLLLLNRQLDLVKFMLDGMNEEVISRVDLEMVSMNKEELNVGLNTLLSSLYLMVRALKLEKEFQEKVSERMMLMIQEMINQGKSREDIKTFLVTRIGMSKDDSEKIINQLLGKSTDKSESGMYA